MDGSDQASNCTTCGGELDSEMRCVACSAPAGSVALKVLPRRSELPAEAPAVPLVRQLKMPTSARLELDAEGVIERLPAVARSVEAAIDAGDFQTAEQGLDQAIGVLIAGPGHVRRRSERGTLTLILWAWCGALVLLLLLNWLTST